MAAENERATLALLESLEPTAESNEDAVVTCVIVAELIDLISV